jgi:hypothetical protein
MTLRILPQFRPSVIICIGEAGELIREYLTPNYAMHPRRLQKPASPSTYHLLANIDPVLRDCIALLQVVTEGDDANPGEALAFPLLDNTFPDDDDDMPKGAGTLAEMIFKALFSVMLARRFDPIWEEDYSISVSRAQVFIVGDPNKNNAPWFAEILKIVREAARKLHYEAPVCYILNSYEFGIDYSHTLKRPLNSPNLKWSAFELPNFSYLYESMITYPLLMTINRDEVRYATAESLLGLVASGLTAWPLYESEMQLPPDLENYARHVGNLSTSMIRFPRPTASRYCASQLTIDLIEKWRHDLDQSTIDPAQRVEVKDQADVLIDQLEGWISEREPRPFAEESRWPSFEILRQGNHPDSPKVAYRQADIYDHLVDKTEDLFELFAYRDITRAYRRRQDRTQTWADMANERWGLSIGQYDEWQRFAREAWNALDARVQSEIRREVDRRWAAVPNGFAVARVFVDEFGDELAKLARRVSETRKDHEVGYRNRRAYFARLADGNWESNRPPGPGGGSGGLGNTAVRARPSMGNTNASGGAGGGLVGRQQAGGGGSGGPPDPEEQIARDLRRRASYKQRIIPSIGVLVSLAVLGGIAATFAASALGVPFASLPIAGALLTALVALVNAGFLAGRWIDSIAARKTILAFDRARYIHRCETQEDTERIHLLLVLRQRIDRMRGRLDNMDTFLEGISTTANGDGQRARDDLFRGAAATRDIFIANGERLQEHGAHTLDSLAANVEQARQNRPLEEWHRTLDTLRDRLIQELRQERLSLMEMEDQDLQRYLYHFTEQVIGGYLVGALVDISVALDKPDIWRDVLERVRRPLYFANTGVRDPHLTFVCGMPQDLNRATQARYIPANAFKVNTRSSEWLMVVSFFRGGDPQTIDGERLFPPKPLSQSDQASATSSPTAAPGVLPGIASAASPGAMPGGGQGPTPAMTPGAVPGAASGRSPNATPGPGELAMLPAPAREMQLEVEREEQILEGELFEDGAVVTGSAASVQPSGALPDYGLDDMNDPVWDIPVPESDTLTETSTDDEMTEESLNGSTAPDPEKTDPDPEKTISRTLKRPIKRSSRPS